MFFSKLSKFLIIFCSLNVSVSTKVYFKNCKDAKIPEFFSGNKSVDNSTYTEPNINSTTLSFWTICRNTFINPFNWVTIVGGPSKNDNILNLADTYAQFGSVQWHSSQQTFAVSNAVIIIITASDEFTDMLKKSSLWSQQSTFVIFVLKCFEDVTSKMSSLWTLYRIYKYVLICGKLNPALYIYRPYVSTEGNKIYQVSNVAEIRKNIVHAVDNLYGSKMRVVLFPRVPTAVIYKGKYIGGADYIALSTLEERMNFTSVIFSPSDGQTFAQPGKNVTGAVRDIVHGNADISLNGHFIKEYKSNKILLTRAAYMERVCFIVAMPSFRSHYMTVVRIFSPSVWGMILTIHLTVIVIYFGIQRVVQTKNKWYRVRDFIFMYYGLIIFGISKIRCEKCCKRFLLGSVLIMVLILNNSFQGSLVTIFNKPIRNHYINTLEDIINSDLALESARAETFLTDPEILQLINVLRHRELNGNNYVRLGRFSTMKLREYTNYWIIKGNSTEYLHRVEECIMSYFLAYVVPRNSPFLDKINTYLLRFQESGLYPKWLSRDMDQVVCQIYCPMDSIQSARRQVKVITMSELEFVFIILFIGFILSATVFLVEFVIGSKNKLI